MDARELYKKNRSKVLDGLMRAQSRGANAYVLNVVERVPISYKLLNEPLLSPPVYRLYFDFEGRLDLIAGHHNAVIRCDGEIMEAIGQTGWIEQLAQKD